jgi:methylamine---glutamate N-methyltransferase subunit B
MTSGDRQRLADVLRRGGLNGEAGVDDFRMYGSARRLYHFHIDNIASY